MGKAVVDKKIAIVYDWIDSWGGVERVLSQLHTIFPQADFFTSYVDLTKAKWAKDLKIITSFIRDLPGFIKKNRRLSFPFYPYAFESFNFTGYNLVISVTSSFAKSIITKPDTFHLCYLLTPTRYLWLYPEQYLSGWQRGIGQLYFQSLKKWDYLAAQRPDKIIAISKTVSERCLKYYDRQAEIVYPGFDGDYWNHIKSKIKNQRSKLEIKNKNFYLVVSRLEPYKRVDLVIEAFNQLGRQLIIVGKGSLENKLRRQAKPNIQFLSDVGDQGLAELYTNAQTLIMPQEEDFGFSALEAQFFGCPVIAFERGGATETVLSHQTGIFFKEQTFESLKQTLLKYDKILTKLKESTGRLGTAQCLKFSQAKFVSSFLYL